MNTFLSQPEATFYHITTLENWAKIKSKGLISNNRKIFVSRVGELPVLLAIAFEQIPEIYESKGIIVLKLPQLKNNFELHEIIRDTQASVEWTQLFQNIICRQYIPIENIGLMMELRFGNEGSVRDMLLAQLVSIANTNKANYQNHSITERASNLRY